MIPNFILKAFLRYFGLPTITFKYRFVDRLSIRIFDYEAMNKYLYHSCAKQSSDISIGCLTCIYNLYHPDLLTR